MSLYENLKGTSPYENSTIELLRDCETARNAVLKDTEVCAIYKDGALHVADKIADYECRLAYNATDEYYDLVADGSDRIYNAMVEWESLPKERGCYTDETLTMMNTLVLLFMHRRAALKLKLIHFMPKSAIPQAMTKRQKQTSRHIGERSILFPKTQSFLILVLSATNAACTNFSVSS